MYINFEDGSSISIDKVGEELQISIQAKHLTPEGTKYTSVSVALDKEQQDMIKKIIEENNEN